MFAGGYCLTVFVYFLSRLNRADELLASCGLVGNQPFVLFAYDFSSVPTPRPVGHTLPAHFAGFAVVVSFALVNSCGSVFRLPGGQSLLIVIIG